ncbi:uncharacterized protein N7458_004366 [Penicillium daleae]|uniref:Uncharacterized protein n=1 Tax=Penicillium daleae TaxID=63821 RepID=A0AAD6C7R7_9EURO|nr:uncharacterized protein N7458_004366 [Penicillium daleae]KAJ5453410.1 hypothetical protein N7458_004366 [Penicillium daleae]
MFIKVRVKEYLSAGEAAMVDQGRMCVLSITDIEPISDNEDEDNEDEDNEGDDESEDESENDEEDEISLDQSMTQRKEAQRKRPRKRISEVLDDIGSL